MARIINSPGVQITEKDLSLRIETPVGTNVVVPGFASQGPTAEPLFITTVSEFEQIYGIPTTAAEKYFYYTCREVLNSPAVLTTVRLPYGLSAGNAFANAYSALFYPLSSSEDSWVIGEPTYKPLNVEQYTKLKAGNFNWSATASLSDSLSATYEEDEDIQAGFFILNDLQTVVNEMGEGYYIGFADNSAFNTEFSPNYESISEIQTLSSLNSSLFTSITNERLDFALSATQAESIKGIVSVSESLEKVGFVGFEKDEYKDHLSLGVFRVRRSTVDANLLSLASTERYLGSFDYNKRQVNPAGGILKSSFIEDDVNTNSPTIKMYVNPAVSKDHNWTTINSLVPSSRITVNDSAKKLFPIGVYAPDTRSAEQTKEIGDVALKLDKVLRTLEVIENTTVDVIVDAGLSTIYAMTDTSTVKTFQEDRYVSNVLDTNFKTAWKAIADTFINFSENTRRDCVSIIDPPRPVFISGKDTKVIDEEGKTFSLNIYNPLRDFASYESNYGAMYGNWVKVQDLYSGRRMWLPFSGYAAAVYARSDREANPWAAPAGMNRGTFNAIDIAFNPNQKQRDRLYEISVNPVVFFSSEGFAVMGQKTLQTKPTAFDRINVRRLFLALERAVQRTMKYFVFEPNTDFTRNRVKNIITPIFEYAKNTEGLYDYLIVCDQRNNTPDTIDNNELIVDIYLKPVRTAEFILVNFIATRTGQNFQELI